MSFSPSLPDIALSMNRTDRSRLAHPDACWYGPVRIEGVYRNARVDWLVYRVEIPAHVPVYVFVKPKAEQRRHGNSGRPYVVRVASVGMHRHYVTWDRHADSPDPLDGIAWRFKAVRGKAVGA